MWPKDNVAKSNVTSHMNGENEKNHYMCVMTDGIPARIQRR